MKSVTNRRKKALIISISKYRNLRTLKFCQKDGEEMFKILKNIGFEEIRNFIGTVKYGDMKDAIMFDR